MSTSTLSFSPSSLNTPGFLGEFSSEAKDNLLQDLSAPDLKILRQRQKNLSKNILEQKDEIDRDDLIKLVERLFEHSVEDGLKLAEQLKCTPSEYLHILANESFQLKHWSVMEEISDHVGRKIGSEKDMRKNLKEDWTHLDKSYIKMTKIHRGEQISMQSNQQSLKSPLASKLLQEMDDIYAQYLRIQEFKTNNPKDQRSVGERLAEQLFAQVKDAGSYYTSRVVEELYTTIVKDISPAKDSYYLSKQSKVLSFLKKLGLDDADRLIGSDVVNPQFLSKILDAIRTNIANFSYDEKSVTEKLQKLLKDAVYKPLGTTFNLQNHLAEKQNKAELESLLASHYGEDWKEKIELAYEKKEGKWKIEELDQKEEGEVTTEVFDMENITKDKSIDDIIEINGKIFVATDMGVFDQQGNLILSKDRFEGGLKIRLFDYNGSLVMTREYSNQVSFEDGDSLKFESEHGMDINVIDINGKSYFLLGLSQEKCSYITDKESNKVIGPFKNFSDQYFGGIDPYTIIGNIHDERCAIDENLDIVKQGLSEKEAYSLKKESRYRKRGLDCDDEDEYKRYIQDPDGAKMLCGKYKNIFGPREENGKISCIGSNFVNGKEVREKVVISQRSRSISPKKETAIIEKEISIMDKPLTGVKTIVNGRICYVFKLRNGGEYIMGEDMHIKRGPVDCSIDSVLGIEDKLCVVYKTSDKYYISDEDGNQNGPFDVISEILDRTEDNPYYFLAKKGNKYFGIDKELLAKEGAKEGKTADILGKIKESKRTIKRVNGEQQILSKDGEVIFSSKVLTNIYGPYQSLGKTYFIGTTQTTFFRISIEGDEIKEIGLTPSEQSKLDLLNLCTPLKDKPESLDDYKQTIQQFLTETSKRKEDHTASGVKKLKQSIQQSGGFALFLSQTIKQLPQLFLDTLPARKDKQEAKLAEEICRRIAPEAFVQEEKTSRFGVSLSGEKASPQKEIDPADYFVNQEYDSLNGADPLEAGKEVMKSREVIKDLMVYSISGAWDINQNARTKSYFPLDPKIPGPKKTNTITIPNIRYNIPLTLPKPLNATILPERVKGVTAEGKEINLPIRTNALNEVTVTVPDTQIQKIIYSIEESETPPKIPNITPKDYDLFKKQFIRENGIIDPETEEKKTPMLDQVAQLDEEELLFLKSIEQHTPKEKLIAIENYVREMGYYDMQNKEVTPYKQGKNNEEKITICQQRMEECKTNNPDLGEDKKWAGVCADFATITVALLRKAGFLSGVISGFSSHGISVTTAHAHAVAYAVIPNQKGKNQIILVDGTPNNGPCRPSLQDLQDTIQQQELYEEEELLHFFDKIDEALEKGSKEDIDALLATMENGNLEDFLNTTLEKEVRMKHYQKLQNLFNIYRYTPLKHTDLQSKDSQTVIQSALRSPDSDMTFDYKQEAKAGTLLFDMIEEFIQRFAKEYGSDNNAYHKVDQLIESSKELLSTIEYKAIKIITKYLKAEKMTKR